jgi:acyl-CoA dehydrogenase
VAAFEVKDYKLPQTDIITEGRGAWDAIFGTVTLGKFFLGFGSIGICEHAYAEAREHLQSRILYGRPVLEMPHIQAAVAQAHARLTAMKLFAYRALDYVHAASEDNRRYLLYCAVQKAKVGTEGVRVMALLSECMGARGFESDTYFEMALRDAPLIPALEGSRHINLELIAQFISNYFFNCSAGLVPPPSLAGGAIVSGENAYLMQARAGGIRGVAFAPFLASYHSLAKVPNVAAFARQAAAFRRVVIVIRAHLRNSAPNQRETLALGDCLASIAYGQLVAEAAALLRVPDPLITAIFSDLVEELSKQALCLATLADDENTRRVIMQMIRVPCPILRK